MIVTSFGTGMSPDVARVDIANIAAYDLHTENAKSGGGDDTITLSAAFK